MKNLTFLLFAIWSLSLHGEVTLYKDSILLGKIAISYHDIVTVKKTKGVTMTTIVYEENKIDRTVTFDRTFKDIVAEINQHGWNFVFTSKFSAVNPSHICLPTFYENGVLLLSHTFGHLVISRTIQSKFKEDIASANEWVFKKVFDLVAESDDFLVKLFHILPKTFHPLIVKKAHEINANLKTKAGITKVLSIVLVEKSYLIQTTINILTSSSAGKAYYDSISKPKTTSTKSKLEFCIRIAEGVMTRVRL